MNPFDPRVLAEMKGLSLRARVVVDGVMVGIHPSRAKGLSTDFEDHREYSQGDDLRHVDWKAYGKFDRYFIKEYREATHLPATILLDASASMGYRSSLWSKFEYGATLAASLTYLLLKQQDAVGLILFSDRIEERVASKSSRRQFFAILKELEEKRPSGETAAGAVLQSLAKSLKRRGLVILISDLFDKEDEVLRGLKQIRSKGNDLIVFQLLDKDELEFPFREPTLFEDLEEKVEILTDPDTIRAAYLKTINALIDLYRESCAGSHIDYSLYDTSIELDRPLLRYLTWRQRFRSL